MATKTPARWARKWLSAQSATVLLLLKRAVYYDTVVGGANVVKGVKMDFNTENKVIIETMNQEEARAYIRFLHSEILRHKRDCEEAYDLIIKVGSKFHIEVFED